MLNWNKMLLLSLLISSTLISITSHSWLGIWMGLEINLMSFIPLIMENYSMFMSEAMISYFLIQTLTSISLLFFIILIKLNSFLYNLTSSVMNISLLMKMGAAPFHFWFPKVMSGLSWMNCLILSTWQKITPMIAISLCMNKLWIMMAIILSNLMGALGGLNQSAIRSLMAFSSISHMSWMLCSLLISLNMWMFYFIIYFFLNFLIMTMLNMNNFFFLNQLFNTKINMMIYFSFSINILSLGGLPPFLGFLPKWLVILFMSLNHMNFIIMLMMIMTLVTLSFYINISLSAFIINYSKIKWFNNSMSIHQMLIVITLTFLSMFSLIFISFMNFSF